MTGSDIRRFFREMLGSRLAEQLTMDILNARADAERIRQDLQGVITELRADKAQLTARLLAYEVKTGVVPSKVPVKPTFDFSGFPPVKTKWQVVQEEHDKKIEKELEEERLAKEATA